MQDDTAYFFEKADKIHPKGKGIVKMGRAFCGFLKGIVWGMVAGAAAGMVAMRYMHHNRRGVKRNVGHALRTVGDLADSLIGMF